MNCRCHGLDESVPAHRAIPLALGMAAERLGTSVSFEWVPTDRIAGIDQVQATLRDAGINPAMVNFAGAATCTASRSDVKPDDSAPPEYAGALHVLRGDMDPMRRVMSEYANGSYGLLMTLAFYAFGLSALLLLGLAWTSRTLGRR